MVAPLWQLSVSCQHMIKSLTLNAYMSLCNLKLAPIFGQQISILDPPSYIGLFGPSWSELSMGEQGGWASDTFFLTDRNVTT